MFYRSLKLGSSIVIIFSGLFFIASMNTSAAHYIDVQEEFFESRVRPVLASYCYDCHTDAAKSGLRVDSREALLKGGRRGPAIVPGKPEESLLIKTINHVDENLRMPKGGAKLSEKEIADLSQWIKDGAYWPTVIAKAKSEYIIKPEHKSFWSFQPIGVPKIPNVNGETNNPIDNFILEKLTAKNLGFSAVADKRTLLRRATYDLTGLPPTSEEIAAFLSDKSPNAFEKVVDRLLSSSHYGEKWARHWLDLARYSDTVGMNDAGRNLQAWFPFAYTYRDWVISAFNRDLPYDQFILQQIAADKLPQNDSHNLAALGFLSLSRGGLGVNQQDKIDDKIDVVSRGLVGLTVSCARCHNHKFDPIPTQDYYSLYTIFNNTREPENLKLPLLDPQAAATDKYTLELKAEQKKIADEIAKMREKRFPELLKLYRSAPEITKCLIGVSESRTIKDDKELQKFAQEKDYNFFMLKRWREYLQKTENKGVWLLWRQFIEIPENEFKDKAGSIISGASNLNPSIAQAFKTTPQSLREAAEIYGKAIAARDTSEPSGKPEEEQLRQVLWASDAPTKIDFSDYEKIFLSTDRQNEEGKESRLTSLFLTQAYAGAAPRAQAVEDVATPQPGYVFLRGKPENKGDQAPPRFLLILAGDNRKTFTNGSGRLELAQSIVDKNNPLTARVIVNRIWQHHFGQGLVRTPSDFGTRGEMPTHPELLDYLARYLVENKWSLKKLHRLILLSRAYQQSSADNAAARQLDPENKLLWHFNRRRLDIEELRDSLLTASGKLDVAMYGLPVSAQAWPFTYRRTIYSFIDRALVPNDFRAFDFADPNLHNAARSLTTVPQQALMMMNSPFVIEQAKAVAQRPEIFAEKNPRLKIQRLYRLLFGRAATTDEIALGLKFVANTGKGEKEGRRERELGREGDKKPVNNSPFANRSVAPSLFPSVSQSLNPSLSSSSSSSVWQYGEGEYDEKADRLKTFHSLDYFINGQWRNSPMPGDPRQPTASLTNKGGVIGENKEHSAIRRWIAPFDGRFVISGIFEHTFENATCRKCKGAFARVISSRAGTVGKWEVLFSKAETNIATIEVRRGEMLDFVVEGGKGTSGSQFNWTVEIKKPDGENLAWNSLRDFRQPSAGELSVWDRYAQALLMTAEFMIIE